MKKELVVLSIVLPLLLLASTVKAPAGAPPQTAETSAKVTVNQYISFTVTPCTATPWGFGSWNPGDTDKPITCQAIGTAAIGLSLDAVTNVGCDIFLKGADFTGPGTIAITNVEYDDDNCLDEPTTSCISDANCPCGTCNTGTGFCYETKNAEGGSLPTAGTWTSAYWSNVKSGASAWTGEGLWYWIDIPGGYLAAGEYTGSLDVKADAHT